MARAYDQVLHWSDLRQVVPLDASAEDSAALAQRFIEAWLRQQVVLRIAEMNRSVEDPDMEAQLEDYRRSLVIFNYEQALVDQKLDTAVTDQEIIDHYEANKADFELKDNILRARWFKVNETDQRVVRKMEQRFLRGDADGMREVEIWSAQRGGTVVDRSDSWVPGTELFAQLGIPGIDMDALIKVGKSVHKHGATVWFVDVVELRKDKSVSPIELVRQDIRSILLNRRKLQLIAEMRENVYRQALENKDVERYDP